MRVVETYRAALEKIARLRPRGPVNEWSEAAAYRRARDIAAKALDPAHVTEGEENLARSKSDVARKKLVLRNGSRGAIYVYENLRVRVLGKGVDRPDCVWVRVIEVMQESFAVRHQAGSEFVCNVWSLRLQDGSTP